MLFAFLFLAALVTRLLSEQLVSPTCRHKRHQLLAGYYQARRNVQPCDNTKHLMTCPEGNSEFCFLKTLKVSQSKAKGNIEGKQNSLFPPGPVIKCLGIPSNSKLGSQICRSFKKHDLITCKSKVHVVVSLGSYM